jgi:hypothetical protein
MCANGRRTKQGYPPRFCSSEKKERWETDFFFSQENQALKKFH